MIIDNQGNVGIGNFGASPGNPGQAPVSLLHVKGDIRVEGGSFIDDGTTLNAPDYVFAPDYKLRPLPQLAAYIEKEQHLPEIPSAQEIKTNGVNLSTFQMQLLKKVEDLTLYTLQQEETISQQKVMIRELKNTLRQVNVRLTTLEHNETASNDTAIGK